MPISPQHGSLEGYPTISESSGPDCSDEVSSSLPMIHAEEKLAFEDIFISKKF